MNSVIARVYCKWHIVLYGTICLLGYAYFLRFLTITTIMATTTTTATKAIIKPVLMFVSSFLVVVGYMNNAYCALFLLLTIHKTVCLFTDIVNSVISTVD
jgi:hypothetical protein